MAQRSIDMFEVIVIGAGIEGSATAYSLSKNGHKTLLLEQFNLPHTRGSSHGQSRITRKAYTKDFYAKMMHEAYDSWEKLAKETDIAVYRKTGLLCFGPPKSATVLSTADALRNNGCSYRILTGAEVKREFPMFDMPDDFIAVHDPIGGMLRADKCLFAFQKMFQQHGGTIRDGAKVTKIFPGDVVTVFTTRGTYKAKSIVITAGPWTSDLVKPLGVHLPLKVIRIAVCYWLEKQPQSFSINKSPCFSRAEGHEGHVAFYGIPEGEYPGLVKICMHVGPEIHPDQRDAVPPGRLAADLQTMQGFIRAHFPGLEDTFSVQESCIYTMTPDEDFILDTHPSWKNIIIGAGFSGHGFKLAPVVGKILGELATNRPLSYDLSPFKISRFFPAVAKSRL